MSPLKDLVVKADSIRVELGDWYLRHKDPPDRSTRNEIEDLMNSLEATLNDLHYYSRQWVHRAVAPNE